MMERFSGQNIYDIKRYLVEWTHTAREIHKRNIEEYWNRTGES